MNASLVAWTVLDWTDVFTADVYRRAIASSLEFCRRRKGLRIHAWVILTSEVQLVVSATDDPPLRNIMRDSKAFTSAEIHRILRYGDAPEPRRAWLLDRLKRAGIRNPANYDFQLWQQVYEPMLLPDREAVLAAIQTVHARPVAAGFVKEAAHWRWSSAGDYAGNRSNLPEVSIIR